MRTVLLSKMDVILEELKGDLHQKAEKWTTLRTPSELYDLEQELQQTLNTFQTKLVGAVLETLHHDESFVEECRQQALAPYTPYQNKGQWIKTPIQTLGGQRIWIKTLYFLPDKSCCPKTSSGKRAQRDSGIFPILRKLGIIGQATPRFLAELSRQIADGPSTDEAQERLMNREIPCKRNRTLRYVRDFTSLALWQRQQSLNTVENDFRFSHYSSVVGKRVVISLDGGRLRIKKDQDKTQKQKKHYTISKCEPKLFVLYTIDKQGEKVNEERFIYEGTLLFVEQIFALLKLRLQQVHIAEAELIVFIGDGASWIWKGVAEVCSSLELEKLPKFEIVDFAHSAGKLAKPASIAIQDVFPRKQWLRKTRKLLKEGRVDEVIQKLERLDKSLDKDEDIRKAIEYFQSHQERMQYTYFMEKGLPIGSGVIESAVRRIVNFRLGGSGSFWRPDTAEGLLYLRCQIKSGRWVSFVKSVCTQWANDMTMTLAQARYIREDIVLRFWESHTVVDAKASYNQAIQWARGILEDGTALFVDTETTGLEDEDEIIQVGIIDPTGHVLLDTFIKPTKDIAQEAYAVHGITEHQVQEAPTFLELYDMLVTLFSGKTLVAYNAEFDRRMLSQTCKAYERSNFESVKWSCAMRQYANFWGKRYGNTFQKQSLAKACQQQGITIQNSHNALADCVLMLELVRAMAHAVEDVF